VYARLVASYLLLLKCTEERHAPFYLRYHQSHRIAHDISPLRLIPSLNHLFSGPSNALGRDRQRYTNTTIRVTALRLTQHLFVCSQVPQMHWAETGNVGFAPNQHLPGTFLATAHDLADPWDDGCDAGAHCCVDTGKPLDPSCNAAHRGFLVQTGQYVAHATLIASVTLFHLFIRSPPSLSPSLSHLFFCFHAQCD
jgi:hypothetical protein